MLIIFTKQTKLNEAAFRVLDDLINFQVDPKVCDCGRSAFDHFTHSGRCCRSVRIHEIWLRDDKRGGSGGGKYCTSELRMEWGLGTLRKNLKGPESRDTGWYSRRIQPLSSEGVFTGMKNAAVVALAPVRVTSDAVISQLRMWASGNLPFKRHTAYCVYIKITKKHT